MKILQQLKNTYEQYNQLDQQIGELDIFDEEQIQEAAENCDFATLAEMQECLTKQQLLLKKQQLVITKINELCMRVGKVLAKQDKYRKANEYPYHYAIDFMDVMVRQDTGTTGVLALQLTNSVYGSLPDTDW